MENTHSWKTKGIRLIEKGLRYCSNNAQLHEHNDLTPIIVPIAMYIQKLNCQLIWSDILYN